MLAGKEIRRLGDLCKVGILFSKIEYN